jgi:hypothetical protein
MAMTDPRSPRGWATCSRCGFIGNLEKFHWQFEYRGLDLSNTQVLVCAGGCLDEPQRQLGSVILPPDPPGLLNARPEAYPADERWPRLLQSGAPRYLQTAGGTKRAQARSLQYSKYFS